MTFEEWCVDKVVYYIDSGAMGFEEVQKLYNLGFEEGYNKGIKEGNQQGYAKAVYDMETTDFMDESGE